MATTLKDVCNAYLAACAEYAATPEGRATAQYDAIVKARAEYCAKKRAKTAEYIARYTDDCDKRAEAQSRKEE